MLYSNMAGTKLKLLGQCILKESILLVSGRLQVTSVRHKIYSPLYISPIVDPKKLDKMMESGEASKLSHIPILPATNTQNVSIYNDPLLAKFTNYLMREGKKIRAQVLMLKAFERIKRMQLKKYHREEDPAEKAKIEVDPLKVFHMAVNNCKPLMQLNPVKRGGATYQVPVPIMASRATFLSMNWLIEAGRQKERKIVWSQQMAVEFIDAANNKGRVIKRKQDLHKVCEANRAYAHYKWG